MKFNQVIQVMLHVVYPVVVSSKLSFPNTFANSAVFGLPSEEVK